MKYRRIWKDNDIVILVSRPLSEKQFYETMMYIGSVLFGVKDEHIIKSWLKEVKEDVSKR